MQCSVISWLCVLAVAILLMAGTVKGGGDWEPPAGSVSNDDSYDDSYDDDVPAGSIVDDDGGDWKGADDYTGSSNVYHGRLFGIGLFLLSFVVLWWYVTGQQVLGAIKSQATTVDASEILGANNNKLVHVTGRVEGRSHRDGKFNVKSGPKALKLERLVEMYQWSERREVVKSEERAGRGKKRVIEQEKFHYTKIWSSRVIDSDNFKDQRKKNPPSIKMGESKTWEAPTFALGGYSLSPALKSSIGGAKSEISQKVYKYGGDPKPSNDERKIGDTRVTHNVVEAREVSMLALQKPGRILDKYIEPSTKRNVTVIKNGTVSLEDILGSKQSSQRNFALFMRLAGFAMMWMGLSWTWQPLVDMVDFIPIVGSLGALANHHNAGVVLLSTVGGGHGHRCLRSGDVPQTVVFDDFWFWT
eukprot:jgi/Bigna1/87853/estExt_fgenesh1_pg.C_250029